MSRLLIEDYFITTYFLSPTHLSTEESWAFAHVNRGSFLQHSCLFFVSHMSKSLVCMYKSVDT
ncbi:hypothetical protein EBR25_06055 [bacterium]|nr:hypothetical protein [bacterium]